MPPASRAFQQVQHLGHRPPALLPGRMLRIAGGETARGPAQAPDCNTHDKATASPSPRPGSPARPRAQANGGPRVDALLLQHQGELQDRLAGQERQDGAAVRAVEDRFIRTGRTFRK